MFSTSFRCLTTHSFNFKSNRAFSTAKFDKILSLNELENIDGSKKIVSNLLEF